MAAFTMLAACDDDPSGPSGAIAIELSEEEVVVALEGTGTVEVTLEREGGYSGAVNLTASDLPEGVTATFTPVQLTGNTVTSELELEVDGEAEVGEHEVKVNATGTGVPTSTVTLTLVIEEPDEGEEEEEQNALTTR